MNQDPTRRAFLQDVADLTALVWNWHEKRLESGAPFSYFADASFDPARASDNIYRESLLHHYGLGIKDSLWDTIQEFRDREPFGTYQRQCRKRILDTGYEQSRVFGDQRGHLWIYLLGGFHTAAHFGVQLAAVRPMLGGHPAGKVAVILSKIRMRQVSDDNILELHSLLGIKSNQRYLPDDRIIGPSYRHGVNIERLRELGYGSTPGCPASMKPSQKCLKILAARGRDWSGTTTERMTNAILVDYDARIKPWYDRLSEGERHHLTISDRELLALSSKN